MVQSASAPGRVADAAGFAAGGKASAYSSSPSGPTRSCLARHLPAGRAGMHRHLLVEAPLYTYGLLDARAGSSGSAPRAHGERGSDRPCQRDQRVRRVTVPGATELLRGSTLSAAFPLHGLMFLDRLAELGAARRRVRGLVGQAAGWGWARTARRPPRPCRPRGRRRPGPRSQRTAPRTSPASRSRPRPSRADDGDHRLELAPGAPRRRREPRRLPRDPERARPEAAECEEGGLAVEQRVELVAGGGHGVQLAGAPYRWSWVSA